MNLVFICALIVTIFMSIKNTPKFSDLEEKYSLKIIKKREIPTYLGYLLLTLYIIFQLISVINSGGISLGALTDLVFESLIYLIFMNLIPRAYIVCDQGVYSYGVFKQTGKLYRWKIIEDVKIDENGRVNFFVHEKGRKSNIHGMIELDIVDKAKEEMKKLIKNS